MDFKALLNDKEIKPKEKTEVLATWLLQTTLLDDFLAFAQQANDPAKGTCIEALEFATKSNPDVATQECLDFVTQSLTSKAPRVKWESAKVIGNIAHLYPTQLDRAVAHLLTNAEHSGTVVRWSAAYALGEILKLQTERNHQLIPATERVYNLEEKDSIKKIYGAAFKKIGYKPQA